MRRPRLKRDLKGIMEQHLAELYLKLPAGVRSVLATAYGYHLKRIRFGPETEKIVEEALDRDTWPAEKLRAWQEEQLAAILHRAVTRVPYYRDLWSERRRKGDHASYEYLENWPVLDKESVRQNPAAFVADDRNIRSMLFNETSGTTGTPISLWATRKTIRTWYALIEARWRLWYGVSRKDRWAIFGGKVVAPIEQQKPPFWVWNQALRQLYMSTYHLRPENAKHYVDALKRYEITYLLGYTSSMVALAEECRRQSLSYRPRVVTTNGEPLFASQRATLTEAFQCPVRETYGMCEMTAAASECEAGRLHLWPEAGWVECFAGGRPAAPGSAGDLILTSLLNVDMPFIRYDIRDRGVLAREDDACRCGRALPGLESLLGRDADTIRTRDGRILSSNCVDIVFGPDTPMLEAQFIQESLECIRVKYIPAPEFDEEAAQRIIAGLKTRIGDVGVELEPVDRIPRGPNGKLRIVVSSLNES